jgi:1,6-anhydro-N-acetylmuramate kinase
MIEVPLLDRLAALADRKRWLLGLVVGPRCRSLHVALVGIEGVGLSCRAEVFAGRSTRAHPECEHLFSRLVSAPRRSPMDAALLAAQLAERQAALLDVFSAEVAPVWSRVLAIAVHDPGLWRKSGGLGLCVGLCDAARLADMSGLNVIDAFSARDLAQDGRGRPLLPIPYWLLLHHVHKNRLLVQWGRRVRLTWLPASRDASGASRVLYFRLPPDADLPDKQYAPTGTVARFVLDSFPKSPPLDELIVLGPAALRETAFHALAALLPVAQSLCLSALGIRPGSLEPAGVALLGLLHLDQIPAGSLAITGARTPRVLGRLTPGSLASWHRLVRELASARPSVVSLRSAV